MTFEEILKKHGADIIALRRKLHHNPELSKQEFQTTTILQEFLEQKGITVTKPLKTGLVASIKRGKGKVIAFRADIDALPVQEETGLDFTSGHENVMHACGHDGHAAILAFTLLCFLEDPSWQGEVRGIFQPSEEMYGGAKPMLASGALSGVDMIFALHIWPELEEGVLASTAGTIMASNDRFSITIKGKSAHGATPHLGTDPIVSACNLVLALQTLISREIAPWEGAVLTIGNISSGTAYNIIPAETILNGTIRTLNNTTRDKLEKGLLRLCDHTAKAFGTEAVVEYVEQYPPTINHLEALKLVQNNLPADLTYREVEHPSMAAEDFAYYLQEIPGALLFLGSGTKEYAYPLHHSKFNFNEKLLTYGAKLFHRVGKAYLSQS